MSFSGFALGLSDPERAGVHAIACGDIPALEAAARDAGLRTARIDLQGCRNKSTLLLRLAVALDFPSGSGRNWDALSDLLRDLSWRDAPGGHALLLDATGDLRDAAPGDYATLLSILEEASEAWAEAGIPFWVFIGLPQEALDDDGGDPGWLP